LYKPQ